MVADSADSGAAVWAALALLQREAPQYLTQEAKGLDEHSVLAALAPPPPSPPLPPPKKAASPPKKAAAAAVEISDSVVEDAALPSDDDENDSALAEAAEKSKAAGNEAFGRGEFAAAVKAFDKAIRLTPKNHVLYSNRSGAHASLGNVAEALSDAEKCIKLSPTWPKGHSRKGAALILCGRYKEAMLAYKRGLEIEPENAGLLKGMEDLKKQLRDGEVPTAAKDGAAPPPKQSAKPAAAATAAATTATTPSHKPAAASAPAYAGGPSSGLAIGQRWIEAAKKGDRPVMEEILKEDFADATALVKQQARGIGHTAMHYAATQGDKRQMEWLVSLGAEVNCRNASEATPLHTAAGNGQAMSVEWLLLHGADGTLVNDDGNTPVAVAKRKGRDDIARAIEEAIANPPPPPPPVGAPTAAGAGGGGFNFADHEEERARD